MKPIIIEIKDNKIVMDVSEFKKHIEDAYQQGYHDGGSCTTIYNDPYWWRQLTVNGPTINCTDSTSANTVLLKADTVDGTITATL